MPSWPVGDPAGMRHLAFLLRATARELADCGGLTAGACDVAAFHAPRAIDWRAGVGDVGRSVQAHAIALVDAAAALEKAAAEVEDEQRAFRAWQRHHEEAV